MEASEQTTVSVACESAPGGRAENEDRCSAQLLDPAQSLWGFRAVLVVADGMGGHEKGEHAAQLAVDAALEVLAARLEDHWSFGGGFAGGEPEDVVRGAFERANQHIYEWAVAEDVPGDTGTTLTIVVATDDGLVVANVGDSPAFLVTEYGIRKLTEDDSWVAEEVRRGRLTEEEAACSPIRNQLTQAVGFDASVDPHILSLPIEPASVVIACSDGLSEIVDPDAICEVVHAGDSVRDLCQALVALAVAAGATDNVTVAALAVGKMPRAMLGMIAEPEPFPQPAVEVIPATPEAPAAEPPTPARDPGPAAEPTPAPQPAGPTSADQRLARQRSQRLGTLLIVSVVALLFGLIVGRATIRSAEPPPETGGLATPSENLDQAAEPPPTLPADQVTSPLEAGFALEVRCEGDLLIVSANEDVTLDVYPRGRFTDANARLLPLEGAPSGETRYRLPQAPPDSWHAQTIKLAIDRLGDGSLRLAPEPDIEVYVDNTAHQGADLSSVKPDGNRARIGFHFPPDAGERAYAIAIAGFPVSPE